MENAARGEPPEEVSEACKVGKVVSVHEHAPTDLPSACPGNQPDTGAAEATHDKGKSVAVEDARASSSQHGGDTDEHSSSDARDEYLASIFHGSTTGTITWQSHLDGQTYFERMLAYSEQRAPLGDDEIARAAEERFTEWQEEREAAATRAEARRAEAAERATAAAEKERQRAARAAERQRLRAELLHRGRVAELDVDLMLAQSRAREERRPPASVPAAAAATVPMVAPAAPPTAAPAAAKPARSRTDEGWAKRKAQKLRRRAEKAESKAADPAASPSQSSGGVTLHSEADTSGTAASGEGDTSGTATARGDAAVRAENKKLRALLRLKDKQATRKAKAAARDGARGAKRELKAAQRARKQSPKKRADGAARGQRRGIMKKKRRSGKGGGKGGGEGS